MGMFDWVYVKCKCPNCGKMKIRQFQTKDLGCSYNEYKFGDEVGRSYLEFLDICWNCRCSINASGIIKDNKLIGIRIYSYEISVNKEFKNCYIWDRNKKKHKYCSLITRKVKA